MVDIPVAKFVEVPRELAPQVSSDLVSGPFLEENGLVFNVKHKLVICKSCCVGFPLSSASTHLTNELMRTWDNDTRMSEKFKAGHPVLIGVETPVDKADFVDKLVQDLISIGAVQKQSEILDASFIPDWKKLLVYTDGTPVEGIRTHIGFACSSCSYALRTYDGMRNHLHFSGPREGQRVVPSRDIMENVELQTFSESFPHFYIVYSTPNSNRHTTESTAPADIPALSVFEQEESRLLKTYQSAKTGPNLRTLAPIFRDGGIEHWLSQFERSQISFLLPGIPLADVKKPSSVFMRLRAAVFKLFAEDLQLLQGGGININIPHILTNGKRWVFFISTKYLV